MKKEGKLIIISAPSGTGKTTLLKELLKDFPSIVFSVSATTRKPRENEKNGIDYFFLSQNEFEELIEKDELLEYEKIYDYYYGTLKSFVFENLKNGKNVMMDIDVKGALNVKNKYPAAKTIFIVPPSLEELEKRLKNRKSDSDEDIKKRLIRAKEEISYKDKFDFLLINDKLEIAKKELKKIIKQIMEESNKSSSY